MEIPPWMSFISTTPLHHTLQKLLQCFRLFFLCNTEMHCRILHPKLASLSQFSMWVIVAGAQFALNSLA